MAVDIDDTLEGIGFGRFQLLMMGICGMGWFVDSVEVGGLAYIYVTLDAEWGTSTADWGRLSSAKSLLSVLGSLAFGIVADRQGRRPSLLSALAVTSLAGLASAASPNYAALFAFRCLTNLGAGGLLPVAMSLLAEHLPPSSRESCIVLMQIFFIAGHVLAVVMSMAFVPGGNWKYFVLAMATPPALLLIVSMRILPESPVYLQQSGKEQEAQEALLRISKMNQRSRRAVNSLPQSDGHEHVMNTPQPVKPQATTGIKRLLSDWASRRRVVAFGLLWALTMVASDWASWITEIGNAHGFGQHAVESFTIVLKVCGMFAFVLAAYCARGGKGPHVFRGALLVSSLAALSCASFDTGGYVFVASVVALAFAYDMVWGLMYAITASAFDPLCRVSAISVATSFSRAAAALVPLVSGQLLVHHEKLALVFWATAWASATGLALRLDFREPAISAGYSIKPNVLGQACEEKDPGGVTELASMDTAVPSSEDHSLGRYAELAISETAEHSSDDHALGV